MTPEGKVVAYIKRRCKANGWEVRKCQWVGHNGAPDLFIMAGDRHVWVEAKADYGVLMSHQEREIARMDKAGCTVFIARGVEGAKRVIDLIEGRPCLTERQR